jgi:hypothetical protein
MDGYTMEVFAEARMQAQLEDVEARRLLRSAAPDGPRPGRARSLLTIAHDLGQWCRQAAAVSPSAQSGAE